MFRSIALFVLAKKLQALMIKIDLAFNFCHQMTKKGVFDYVGDVHTINFV